MTEMQGKNVRVSVSAVGNVDVPVADYNIITPIVIVWPGSFNSNVSRPTTEASAS